MRVHYRYVDLELVRSHIAYEKVDGETLHRVCGMYIKTKEIGYKLIRSHLNENGTHATFDGGGEYDPIVQLEHLSTSEA